MKTLITSSLAIIINFGIIGLVTANTLVTIQSGSLQGTKNNGVEKYLGIPFAAAPVGKLRWRDPEPAVRWDGIRDATKASRSCFQAPPTNFGPYTSEFIINEDVSEDCLYLNVWKPINTPKGLPVFVYIHGGGFGTGSSNISIYNGEALAKKGVVVVTINYRLGIFGYLAHPELTRENKNKRSGNYGLLDQIAALDWVQKNIAMFGGNPHNVTIAGQSAGAASVNDLIMSPMAKGLFHRAIAQSGAGMGVYAASLVSAERYGMQLQARIGAHSLSEMRELSASILQEISAVSPPATNVHSGMPSIILSPIVDGVVLPTDPSDPYAKIASPVPLLTGFNSDEAGLFGKPQNSAEFEEFVRNRYDTFADRFLKLYPHGSDSDVALSFAEIGRDRYMASLVLWGINRAKSSGQSIYTYLFDHPYPGLKGEASLGAFHTAEIPYVMGTLNAPNRVFTEKDKQISAKLQAHWLAFMETGDPSVPGYAWSKLIIKPEVMKIGDKEGMQYAVSTLERFLAFKHYVESGGKLSLF